MGTTSNEDDYDHLCKVVLVGDVSVGKSHLLSRYMKDELPKAPAATIGVEFATRTVKLPGGQGTIKAQIWDTAGQERYRAITRAHYRRAVGAVLVYDVTRMSTFQSCTKWVDEVRQGASPDAVIHLVGNKIDLVEKDPSTRQVWRDVALQFAQEQGLQFSEASAVSALNVHAVFESLFQDISQRSGASSKAAKTGITTAGGIHIASAGQGQEAGCEAGAC